MMTPIDALADAIMTFEGWKLGSRSYRNRNPGNLRASPRATGDDGAGYAVFSSLSVGYDALQWDLVEKVSGRSSHGLTPQSSMLDLLNCYAPAGDRNNPSQYCAFVCDWLTRALGQPFTPVSPLSALTPLLTSVKS